MDNCNDEFTKLLLKSIDTFCDVLYNVYDNSTKVPLLRVRPTLEQTMFSYTTVTLRFSVLCFLSQHRLGARLSGRCFLYPRIA